VAPEWWRPFAAAGLEKFFAVSIGAIVEMAGSHPSQLGEIDDSDTNRSTPPWGACGTRGAGTSRRNLNVPTRRRGIGRRLARPRTATGCRVPRLLAFGGNGGRASLLGAITGKVDRDVTSDRELRDALRGFLDRFHVPVSARYDIVLAVGEAITNAIRYGQGNDLQWQAIATHEQITVELKYRSTRFDTAPIPPEPDKLAQGGRGILIMRSVTDDLEYRFLRGEVRVRMIKKLKP